MLDELRKKPKGVKAQYAFWGAFLITALIALFWLVSLQVKFNDKPAFDSGTSAFSRFISDTKTGFSDISDSIKDLGSGEGDVEADTSTKPELKQDTPPPKTIQIVGTSSKRDTVSQ